MPHTQQTQITCKKSGHPNHLATKCTAQRSPPRPGAQNSPTENSKN